MALHLTTVEGIGIRQGEIIRDMHGRTFVFDRITDLPFHQAKIAARRLNVATDDPEGGIQEMGRGLFPDYEIVDDQA